MLEGVTGNKSITSDRLPRLTELMNKTGSNTIVANVRPTERARLFENVVFSHPIGESAHCRAVIMAVSSPAVNTVCTVRLTLAQEGFVRSKCVAKLDNPVIELDAFYPACVDQIDMGISTRATADSPNGRLTFGSGLDWQSEQWPFFHPLSNALAPNAPICHHKSQLKQG